MNIRESHEPNSFAEIFEKVTISTKFKDFKIQSQIDQEGLFREGKSVRRGMTSIIT